MISQPKKNTSRVPMIINGPKGISLFIVRFLEDKDNTRLKIMSVKPTIAPIQKANTSAEIPRTKPSIKPTPTTILASPKPIHRPPDTSHKSAKGRASIGPARTSKRELLCK